MKEQIKNFIFTTIIFGEKIRKLYFQHFILGGGGGGGGGDKQNFYFYSRFYEERKF